MSQPGSMFLRYTVAIVSIALAIALRLLLDPQLGTQFPFATVFLAVLVTAWYGGFRPAMVAVLLGGLAADYFLLPPRGRFAPIGEEQRMGLILYTLTGLGIALLAGSMHAAQRALREGNGGQPIGFVNATQDSTERKGAETALREAEERLTFALRYSHMGGWDLDLVDYTAHRTLEHDQIFGYASLLPEWTYQMFLEHVVPEDRAEVDRRFQQATSTQTDWGFECRIRRADGEVRWIWAAGGHQFDREGRARRMAGIVQDITDRKIVEESLRQSEERLQLMIEGVSDHAILMLDPTGEVLTWSRAAERIDGYTAEEIIGQNYSRLFTPESLAEGAPQRELELAAREGKAAIEGWRVRKDGSRFWANGTLAALYDDHGNVRGFAKVTRDLTAKRRNDELLRSVLDHTLDGIIGIDEQGIVTMINRAGESMFGYSGAEVIGRNVDLLMPEPYKAEHAQYLANYMRTGEAKIIGIGREVSGLRKNGSTFPLDLAVTEFQLDRRRHFVGIVRDISERRKLEAQLHQAQKMEAFGQLAGGVAHDFNNLLTIIGVYTDLLLSEMSEDDAKKSPLVEVRQAAGRAASLTGQLLAFSRKQVLEPKVVDLNSVVGETQTMLKRVIGEDITLVAVLAPDLESVKVDPGQIQQVIMNLAVNARDAMPQGGKLTIETQNVRLDEFYADTHVEVTPGRYVLLAMTDTGCGMPPEVEARIFEPFFTTKGVGKGTGLGLAVVHGIVKQSSGSITVYSEAGLGTTFKVYLPAIEGPAASSASAGRVEPAHGKETILVVEDEEAVRAVTVLTLERSGYSVLSASSGEDALRLMENRSQKIDLLVTDVVMPGMSGAALAERMRSSDPGLNVLFLSGYTDDAVLRHGILQEHVAFLQKPFTRVTLTRKVRSVLDRA